MSTSFLTLLSISAAALALIASQVVSYRKEHRLSCEMRKALACELLLNHTRLVTFLDWATRDTPPTDVRSVEIAPARYRILDARVPIWSTDMWTKNLGAYSTLLDDSPGSGTLVQVAVAYQRLHDLTAKYADLPGLTKSDNGTRDTEEAKLMRAAVWQDFAHLQARLLQSSSAQSSKAGTPPTSLSLYRLARTIQRDAVVEFEAAAQLTSARYRSLCRLKADADDIRFQLSHVGTLSLSPEDIAATDLGIFSRLLALDLQARRREYRDADNTGFPSSGAPKTRPDLTPPGASGRPGRLSSPAPH